MKKIVVGDIVSRAWDLAVKHWPIFVLLNLVNSMISGTMYKVDSATLMEAANSGDPTAIMEAYSQAISFNPIWGTIAFLLAIYIGYIGINMYVNAYRLGKPYETMGEIFKTDINQLAIYFAVNLVYGLAVGIGCCLCIIPGIWIGVRWMYAPMLAASQGASFTEAFSRSWELTKGNFWDLFLLGLTAFGIVILGFVACCIGYLFAAVIIEFMLVVSFFVLKGNDPEPAPEVEPVVEETTDFVEVQ